METARELSLRVFQRPCDPSFQIGLLLRWPAGSLLGIHGDETSRALCAVTGADRLIQTLQLLFSSSICFRNCSRSASSRLRFFVLAAQANGSPHQAATNSGTIFSNRCTLASLRRVRCSRLPTCIIGLTSMRDLLIWALALTTLAINSHAMPPRRSDWQRAVDQSAMSLPDSRIVIIDRASGMIVASHQLKAASRTLATPGSVLKPLLLYRSIDTRQWASSNRVACNRHLLIGKHMLACSHPEAPPFDAREALAWSCNSYFAAMACTLRPGQMKTLLEPTRLLEPTGLAPGEAVAEFHEPSSLEEQQLAVLGLSDIRITPLELAVAYRWLANEMAKHPQTAATQTVAAGLTDSADFGIASGTGARGGSVAGKTGTAEGTQSSRTHGWFAGLAPAKDPQVVIVVYVPTGRGADAARVAGEIVRRASR